MGQWGAMKGLKKEKGIMGLALQKLSWAQCTEGLEGTGPGGAKTS